MGHRPRGGPELHQRPALRCRVVEGRHGHGFWGPARLGGERADRPRSVRRLRIALAQLIGLGLQQAGGMAAAAHGRAGVALVINAANTAFRVGAILIFYFMISDQTVDAWARFLAVSMIGGSLATVTIVRVALDGRLRFQTPERRDLRLGGGFVFVAAANTVQADVDKVVLGGYGLLEDNGVYAAGYRVADFASLPLTALVKASYAEFFRRGSASVTESVRYARKLTAVSVSYGLAAGGLLWLAAPALRTFIGDEYEESVTVLRWIAIVPAIKAAQYFPANVLTGVDRQWVRARLMAGTAILNLLINLAFARRFGWRGAAVGTLIAEALFTCLLWLAVRRELHQEQHRDSPEPEDT